MASIPSHVGSSTSITGSPQTEAPRGGFRQLAYKLNHQWHERALQAFMVIVLGHWAEHLIQAYQIYGLHWPRPKAGGMLGLWYPWLVKSETLHFGYAIVMLFCLILLRPGFKGRSEMWWTVSLWIQMWHFFEHTLLQGQALFHHNLFNSPVPCSLLQLVMQRVEAHLFYNTIVFIPMVIAMYYHKFPPLGEEAHQGCTCAYQPKPVQVPATA